MPAGIGSCLSQTGFYSRFDHNIEVRAEKGLVEIESHTSEGLFHILRCLRCFPLKPAPTSDKMIMLSGSALQDYT
jgi:hypothetical protein